MRADFKTEEDISEYHLHALATPVKDEEEERERRAEPVDISDLRRVPPAESDIEAATLSLPPEQRELVLKMRGKAEDMVEMYYDAQWREVMRKENIVVRMRPAEGSMVFMRGETDFPFPLEKVVQFIFDPVEGKHYDNLLDDGAIFEHIPFYTFKAYTKFKKILMVSSRDLVLCAQLVRLTNNVLVVATTSVIDERYPEVSSSVRADLKLGGWILFP